MQVEFHRANGLQRDTASSALELLSTVARSHWLQCYLAGDSVRRSQQSHVPLRLGSIFRGTPAAAVRELVRSWCTAAENAARCFPCLTRMYFSHSSAASWIILRLLNSLSCLLRPSGDRLAFARGVCAAEPCYSLSKTAQVAQVAGHIQGFLTRCAFPFYVYQLVALWRVNIRALPRRSVRGGCTHLHRFFIHQASLLCGETSNEAGDFWCRPAL